MEEDLEMKVTNAEDYFFFFSLPGHPLKSEIHLNRKNVTRYERKTLTMTDWRTPIQKFELQSIDIISFVLALHYSQIYIKMQFFKKMLGLDKGLEQRIADFKAKGTLFEVVKQTRDLKLVDGTISFCKQSDTYQVSFDGQKNESYQLPIHLNMNPVTFTIHKQGNQFACFQWQLEIETDHVGCYMQPEKKGEFKEILCLILKQLAKDEHIKDHLVFCKELQGVPVYKTADKKANTNVSSSIASEDRVDLNKILIKQAQKQENKMVHTCSLYHVHQKQRKLIQEHAIFVLKAYPNFQYEFHLINATGYTFEKKTIDSGLNYEINLEFGYIRWINLESDCLIVQVNFEGKRDAALSLKYNMLEVMYQLRQHRKLDEAMPADEIAYMKKISEEKPLEEAAKDKVVEFYQHNQKIQKVEAKDLIFQDQEIKEGRQYGSLCQAKIKDFSIAALGSLMQTLHISEDSHIQSNDKRRLFDRNAREVDISEIILHDQDSKGVLRGKDGKLYYQDLHKGKLIQQFKPSPKKGIVMICPEFKLAEAGNYNTFKAISENAIFEIDPRIEDGVGNMKQYTGNPQFTTISPSGEGNFATGSKNGQIRFYKEIGKNANNKFTAAGEPVINLDTTKDGKWVLATFKRYIRLIPTENNNDDSLFHKKIAFDNRPQPIKLQISLQDIQTYGAKDFSLLPAKFDESKEGREKFILTGFGQFTVIWNLGQILKGDKSYLISKTEGKVLQAQFFYNNPSKIIMTTSQGIAIKENRIKK